MNAKNPAPLAIENCGNQRAKWGSSGSNITVYGVTRRVRSPARQGDESVSARCWPPR